MDAIKGLEDRINSLIELTNQLKKENESLRADKEDAEGRLSKIEASAREDSNYVGKLKEEQELTKLAVDDLIKSIDTLIAKQEQV